MTNSDDRTRLDRRTLLMGAGVAVGGMSIAAITGTPAVAADTLPLVAPLPPGQPDRSQFAPGEQRYAGYLVILAPMANDITEDGFMGGGWWVSPPRWFNSRAQWHVYTLTWFYCNDRPWNPYYNDPALGARLDAAIGYYLGLQHPDGAWPQASPTERSRAATGFGMGYLSKTLAILRQAGALPQRQVELTAALHRAMTWFLDPDAWRGEPTAPNPLWATYVPGLNQAAAGLAGAALALQLNPDTTLHAQWLDRIAYLADRGQSPAGYFYEILGADWGYNFNVGLPEMAEIYLLTGNQTVQSMTARFADWFGYVNLREPDGTGWLTYDAISGRTGTKALDDLTPDPCRQILGSHFAPEVPALRAFYTSAEDMAAARADWAADPDPVPALVKTDTSPRIISHAPYSETLPSASDKAAAIGDLPYLREDEFIELRRDATFDRDFLFIRRPSFYLGTHFGPRDTTSIRSGLGFLWHPRAGTIVQSQRASNTTCWGTVRSSGIPDANSDLVAEYLTGERLWDGSRVNPPSTDLRIRYRTPDATPASDAVTTELIVTRAVIIRRVRAAAPATEQIPLVLQPNDEITLADGTTAEYGGNTTATTTAISIKRAGSTITFEWGEPLLLTFSAEPLPFLRDQRRQLHILRVQHPGRFQVKLKFNG